MSEMEMTTLARIHAAAKEEFLQKGFQKASLRNIVKQAGVTTGAFYGYYESKEALFDALVREHYEHVMGEYQATLEAFAELPPEEQPEQMDKLSGDCMKEMLLYMTEHRDAFHLLLQCAEGTRYGAMVDDAVALEEDATHRYYEVLSKLGHPVPHIDARLEHILVTGMMNAYFEIVRHDMPLPDAMRYLEELHAFYTAGWTKIMGQ